MTFKLSIHSNKYILLISVVVLTPLTVLSLVQGFGYYARSNFILKGTHHQTSSWSRLSNTIADVHTFDVPDAPLVAMNIFDTVHYPLDQSGVPQYSQLMPSGGHVVHISDLSNQKSSPEAYTVTLFHQLKCLDIIHHNYINDASPSPLLSHCMNYLRQTVLCHPDTRIESVKSKAGKSSRQYETVCRDWSVVYEEAERNFESYTRVWKHYFVLRTVVTPVIIEKKQTTSLIHTA